MENRDISYIETIKKTLLCYYQLLYGSFKEMCREINQHIKEGKVLETSIEAEKNGIGKKLEGIKEKIRSSLNDDKTDSHLHVIHKLNILHDEIENLYNRLGMPELGMPRGVWEELDDNGNYVPPAQ